MKRILALVLALLCFLAFAGTALAEIKLPEAPVGQDRFVQDYANLLTPQDRDTIIGISNQLYQQTKAEIVVVTVNSLDGQEIFDYSQALFRKWQIGDKTKNNGILIVINKENLLTNQRNKMRIHIGYGLEGALPDAKAGQIRDQIMYPRFAQKDYSGGITEGYKAVAGIVAGEYNIKLSENQATPDQNNYAPQKVTLPKWTVIVGAIILIILLVIDNTLLGGFFTGLILGMLFSGGFRGGGGGFGGGGGGGFGGGDSGGGGAEG